MNTRYFSPEPAQQSIAVALYDAIKDLPLVCPHGHVDPRLFADPDYRFGSPVDLLIIPDHYVFRMMYSQGVPLTALGIPRSDGGTVETDHRKIWQTVCDHWYLMRGTPTGIWMRDELREVFGIDAKMNSASAQDIYTTIDAKLQQPDFNPRHLYQQFNIEVLATTDAATDTL
ncbi:MAG: glucuronate isomerase, partial [Chloroflexota bacterium]